MFLFPIVTSINNKKNKKGSNQSFQVMPIAYPGVAVVHHPVVVEQPVHPVAVVNGPPVFFFGRQNPFVWFS